MKLLLSVYLIILFSFFVFGQSTATVTVSIANVRDMPTMDGLVVFKAKQGARLELIISEEKDGWYAIKDPITKKRGWIHKSTIKFRPQGAFAIPDSISEKDPRIDPELAKVFSQGDEQWKVIGKTGKGVYLLEEATVTVNGGVRTAKVKFVNTSIAKITEDYIIYTDYRFNCQSKTARSTHVYSMDYDFKTKSDLSEIVNLELQPNSVTEGIFRRVCDIPVSLSDSTTNSIIKDKPCNSLLWQKANEDSGFDQAVFMNKTYALIEFNSSDRLVKLLDIETSEMIKVDCSSVQIYYTNKPKDDTKYFVKKCGGRNGQMPEINITNATSKVLTLYVGDQKFTFDPQTSNKVNIPAGNHNFTATAPNTVPAIGREYWESGCSYSWRFWIETVRR